MKKLEEIIVILSIGILILALGEAYLIAHTLSGGSSAAQQQVPQNTSAKAISAPQTAFIPAGGKVVKIGSGGFDVGGGTAGTTHIDVSSNTAIVSAGKQKDRSTLMNDME